jgi:hypothetical protein
MTYARIGSLKTGVAASTRPRARPAVRSRRSRARSGRSSSNWVLPCFTHDPKRTADITKEIDPATFLDSSFIAAANDWTTDDVKKNLKAWKEANKDKLIN